MLLTGKYEHTIDAKNRLAIPSDFRDALERAGASRVFYAAPVEGSLALFPEDVFEKRTEALDSSPLSPDEVLEYEDLFFSSVYRVEIDGQHRIRIPKEVMDELDIGRDVVLLGVRDHIKVKNREAWRAERREKLARHPGLLMNPRRLLGGPGEASAN